MLVLNKIESDEYINKKCEELREINNEYNNTTNKKEVFKRYKTFIEQVENVELESKVYIHRSILAQACYNAGVCCIRINDFKSAIYYNNKSLEYDNKTSNVYYNLSLAYIGMLDIETALEYSKKAFELDNNDSQCKSLFNRLLKANTINPILKELAES